MLKYPRLTQETSSKNIKKQLSSAFSFFFCCDFRLSSPGRCDGVRFRNPAGASLFDETPLHILHHMASNFQEKKNSHVSSYSGLFESMAPPFRQQIIPMNDVYL